MNIYLETLKRIIREAWQTLMMLPDPDARFRRSLGGGFVLPIIQETRDAYGAKEANCRGTPTPRDISIMEKVFDWLVWLRGQIPPDGGEYSIRRIAAWSLGRPVWKIAQAERCSERTINRRIDRSIAKIGVAHKGQIAKIIPKFEIGGVEKMIPLIDEPERIRERVRGFRPPREPDQSGRTAEAGKVYIGGEGFRIKGKKYRSSADLAENAGGKRRR